MTGENSTVNSLQIISLCHHCTLPSRCDWSASSAVLWSHKKSESADEIMCFEFSVKDMV